ncbi:MAG: Glu/Leu/Phe/Val dehydrogenase [Gammaproteobacteria bacterium]|nr:Glu/Leu/Phe/Val dehydrogenase [Gammaproteobacteria bacterium]
MTDEFLFCDDLGPEKIIEIYDPETALKAVLVVDNVALGPAIGGVRMAKDVTLEECARLARAMTLKNAAAGLDHGGGKSAIVADSRTSAAEKEALIRAFARAIRQIVDYVPGPDMGTNETAMAWVKNEIGRAAGLPAKLGGIPLDEIGSTGFGLAAALKVAQDFAEFRIEGGRIAIQGFGAVGQHAARYLSDMGAVVVAVSDSRGAVHNADGVDVKALIEFKRAGNAVADLGIGDKMESDALLDVDCDVWIPAARPDVLTASNVHRIKAKIIAQGANIPATEEAERMLAERGVLVLPDFIANAGGVICAAVELAGGTEADAMRMVEDKICANLRSVLEVSEKENLLPRVAATKMARKRVLDAMASRRAKSDQQLPST